MRRRMMKSKIHRATVTDANLNYVGSISIDTRLMEQADILEWEQVAVLDRCEGRGPAGVDELGQRLAAPGRGGGGDGRGVRHRHGRVGRRGRHGPRMYPWMSRYPRTRETWRHNYAENSPASTA